MFSPRIDLGLRFSILATILVLGASLALASGDAWTVSMTGHPADEQESHPVELRLAGVSFEIDVMGSVAVGSLVQEFVNDSDEVVQATYVGQPSAGMRVNTLVAEQDGESIELLGPAPQPEKQRAAGRQTKRAAAQPRASEAKLSVEPAESVLVRSGFQLTPTLLDGRFTLRLPAVVSAQEGALDPLAEIRVTVHHDEPLLHADSTSHDIFVSFQGDFSVVDLASGPGESRAFEFEYAMGAAEASTALGFVGPEQEDGTRNVLVTLAPPMEPREETVRPKQVLFIMDTSGSMAKEKIAQARIALAACLEKLGPEDHFNLVEFDAQFTMMREEPIPAEADRLAEAGAWLGRQHAGGGTKMLPALAATLAQPESSELHRMIVILTDGALSDTQEVLSMLEQNLGAGRLFVVGIGEDVRKEAILAIAEFGRGTAAFATDPEGLAQAMAGLFDSVSAPLAWDLRLNWGDAQGELVSPRRLPDLYAGRPVTIRARVRGPLPDEITVESSTMEGSQTMIVPLADADLSRLQTSSRKASTPKNRR